MIYSFQINENIFVDNFIFCFNVSLFDCFSFPSAFLSSKPFRNNQMHCEIIYRHFNLFVCRNTTEKSKLEKCYSDNKVWAPKCYNGLSNDLDKSLHVSLIKFSCWSKLHVNIITGLELRELSFTRDLPVIQKSEIPLSEFCPISGD